VGKVKRRFPAGSGCIVPRFLGNSLVVRGSPSTTMQTCARICATRRPRSRLYLGHQAHLQAQSRGTQSHQPHRMRRDRLVDWVIKRLEKGWTPQGISGRLGIEFPSDAWMRVCTEIIYAWIYAPAQQLRQFWQYLPRGAKKRHRRQGRRVHSERIKWRTSIHEAPPRCQIVASSGIGNSTVS
jgi:IS30 family transposase